MIRLCVCVCVCVCVCGPWRVWPRVCVRVYVWAGGFCVNYLCVCVYVVMGVLRRPISVPPHPRDGGSHRRCPSATQHVTPPAAVPTRDNADDGREGKDEQPPLPSITGGTLCASNGPLQNPQSEVLLIKNKPKTMHHKNQRIQKPGVV